MSVPVLADATAAPDQQQQQQHDDAYEPENDDFAGQVQLGMLMRPTGMGEPLRVRFHVTNNTEDDIEGARLMVADNSGYQQAVAKLSTVVEANGGTGEIDLTLVPKGHVGLRRMPAKLKVMFAGHRFNFPMPLSAFAKATLKSRHVLEESGEQYHPTIAVVGPVGSGKSSFCNTANALMTQEGMKHATCLPVGTSGTAGKSLTKGLTRLVTDRFDLMDTWGVSATTRDNWLPQHMKLFLAGKLADGATEELMARMSEKKLAKLEAEMAPVSGRRKDATVFLVPAQMLLDPCADPQGAARMVAVFDGVRAQGPVVAVTHADVIYGGRAGVEAARSELQTKAAQMLGVAAKRVLIVVNYTTEDERTFEQDRDVFEVIAAAIESADERLSQEQQRGAA